MLCDVLLLRICSCYSKHFPMESKLPFFGLPVFPEEADFEISLCGSISVMSHAALERRVSVRDQHMWCCARGGERCCAQMWAWEPCSLASGITQGVLPLGSWRDSRGRCWGGASTWEARREGVAVRVT